MYKISKHESGSQLVYFKGRITFGRETERCRNEVKELINQKENRFVFDMADVEYVDSAGIGFLVSCLITIGSGGAKLRLASPPERVRHVLGITKLDTVFEICPTREQAMAGFA